MKTIRGTGTRKTRNAGPKSTDSQLTASRRGYLKNTVVTLYDEGPVLEDADDPQTKKRRGPVPFCYDSAVSGRNHLIQFLEAEWPSILFILNEGQPPHQALAAKALRAFCEQKRIMYHAGAPHLLSKAYEAVVIWQDKKRICGDPRNLANALACIPFVKWRTSLNRMSQIPYSGFIMHENAIPDYFRRRYPKRHAELIGANSVSDVKRILAKTQSTDSDYSYFRSYPEAVLQAFHK